MPSVETSLFQNYVFAHDQTVSRHLLQGWQDAVHMLISIHEDNDQGNLSSSIYKMTGLNPVPAEKSSHSVESGCGINVFPPQVVKDLHVQRPVTPVVGFVEINGDLNSHRVWHFTAPGPEPLRPALHRGKVYCCSARW